MLPRLDEPTQERALPHLARSMPEAPDAAYAAAERVARTSYGKLVALLAARTRDVAGAEDALSDAFASALVDWPRHGVPATPEAWLLTVARRKWIDAARRRRTADEAADHLRLVAEELAEAAAARSELTDERLALMFACAHPAIDARIRAPLMLQTVLGMDAAEIAGAFGVSPAAMRQRLVRAKHRIREARIPFEVPERRDLAPRLGAVLEAIGTAFAQSAAPGRRALADEALWLGRLVASLLPGVPAARSLLASMLGRVAPYVAAPRAQLSRALRAAR